MKHVFIDTNVLLKIYSFTDDYPNLLDNLIKKIEKGKIKLYLTDQFIDEFNRNREIKLSSSLDKIKKLTKLEKFEIPAFCKDVRSLKTIQKKFSDIKSSAKKAYDKLMNDSIKQTLEFDKLFRKLCRKVSIIKTTSEIIKEAKERFDKGNPPGKNKSYGDAINWLLLLKEVPNNKNLYLITVDGDYHSKINDELLNSFLRKEWKGKKKSIVIVYKSISRFLKYEFREGKITKKQIEIEESTGQGVSTFSDVLRDVRTGPIVSPLYPSESFFTGSTSSNLFKSPLEKEIKCSICIRTFYTEEVGSAICPYCKSNNFGI